MSRYGPCQSSMLTTRKVFPSMEVVMSLDRFFKASLVAVLICSASACWNAVLAQASNTLCFGGGSGGGAGDATAAGLSAFACGYHAKAIGDNSTAVGTDSAATTNGTAI